MLHSLGRGPKQKKDDDLVGALLACHERIRRFLRLAEMTATRGDLASTDVVDGCLAVERYFREALPLHVRDENESILPRLQGVRPALDEALARMHAEHHTHDEGVRELLEASARVRQNTEDGGMKSELLVAARRVSNELEDHLRREEEVIFPAIRELFTLETQREVLEEFRARRET